MTLPSPTILQSAGGCNTTGLLTEVITSKKVRLTCHLLADRVAARWLVAGDPDSYIGQQILRSP